MHQLDPRANRLRRAALSAILVIGAGLSCETPVAPAPSDNAQHLQSQETWTIQLDQDCAEGFDVHHPFCGLHTQDTKGRMWIVMSVSLRQDAARDTCAGPAARIATILGDFVSQTGRILPVALEGSAVGSWSYAGMCSGFELRLSPHGDEEIVIRDVFPRPVFTPNSFGPSATGFVPLQGAGTWIWGARRGHAFVYRGVPDYMPDSHYEIVGTLSDNTSPADPADEHLASTLSPLGSTRGQHDTSFTVTVRRHFGRIPDTTMFALTHYENSFGGITTDHDIPLAKTICIRDPAGPDRVYVDALATDGPTTIPPPFVRCRAGWTGPAAPRLTIVSGGGQSGTIGQQLASPIVVRIDTVDISGGATPVSGIEVVFTPPAGGAVSPGVVTTAADGRAQTRWILASGSGTQTLTVQARHPGQPFFVTAAVNAIAGAPSNCAAGAATHASNIAANQTWSASIDHLVTTPIIVQNATLTVGDGAHVCFAPGAGITFAYGAAIEMTGMATPTLFVPNDAAHPDWAGLRFTGTSSVSHIRNVVIDHGAVRADQNSVVQIQSSVVRNATAPALEMRGNLPGSPSIAFDMTVEDTRGADTAAVILGAPSSLAGAQFRGTVQRSAGDGIQIQGSGGSVAQCKVIANGRDGIVVTGSFINVVVTECNIELNGGLGLRNTGTIVIYAGQNWWGDSAGPTGPNANHVVGPAQVNPFATTRYP